MNKAIGLFLVLLWQASFSQTTPITKEAFVNKIIDQVVDSSLTSEGYLNYYLVNEAMPCSFKKFDYGELVKYSLDRMIPIYALNELAKNSTEDTLKDSWSQQNLINAICISNEKADSIFLRPENIHASNKKQKKQALEKLNSDVWDKTMFDKSYFIFSKPEFTTDQEYAVMDITFKCGKSCSSGWTYIFVRNEDDWKVAGRILVWSI